MAKKKSKTTFKGKARYRLCARLAEDEVSVAKLVFVSDDGEEIPHWVKRRTKNEDPRVEKLVEALVADMKCEIFEDCVARSRIRVRTLDGSPAPAHWGGMQGALTAGHEVEFTASI